MSDEVWYSQTDVNFKSVYLFWHLVLPVIEKQDGGGVWSIFSSVTGPQYIGKPPVAYAASKAAVIRFTNTTAGTSAKKAGGRTRSCRV